MPPPDFSTDLAERIDRSFGVGPDMTLSVDVLLSRGRLIRRRRRTAATGAVAALAVAVVVGATWARVGGTNDVRGTGEYVASPSPTATTTPTSGATPAGPVPEGEREQLKRWADRAVTFGGDGRVTLPRGASVVRTLANPFGAAPPAWSRGLAVEFRGHEFWYAMSGSGDGSVTGATQYLVLPQDGQTAFERFVADQDPHGATTSSVGPDVWPDVRSINPVHMTIGGTLAPEPGYQVVSQRFGVDVGRAWAGPRDGTAAALVRAHDGSTYYVLARRFSGKPAQYVTVPTAGNGADLTAFVAVATARYATFASGR
jgi:hypothetical protein